MDEWQRPGTPLVVMLTALPKEHAAVRTILQDPREVEVRGHSTAYIATLASIPSADGGHRRVLLPPPLPQMGNNLAAVRATGILENIHTLTGLLMVGIAGGVPNPTKAEDHVRLGDIVVSGPEGVVQYDIGKAEPERFTHRNPPRPPGATLLTTVRALQSGEFRQERPWEAMITRGLQALGWARPSEETDNLASTEDPSRIVTHPVDPQRQPGYPRVFVGPIAASNTLLKDAARRDALRDAFGVKAVEMEGSGIADAAWVADTPYLVVRGICDYCSPDKGDTWQQYAALVAAAYACAVVTMLPASGRRGVAASDDWWRRLERVATELYSLGPTDREIWARGGGDLAALRLGDTGRATWFAALRVLRQGGGGTTPLSLVNAMLEDFGQHSTLLVLAREMR